ncbi:MAG: succinate dehydrogenase cytochrome b subunit [Deltaproteobacteria bacterium]|nr:succinate dehydrogenase cytochrome b subunit [Deltaproteobacteria bacterium]
MNWLTAALGASVGKKLMMALTGLAFTGFLAGHLAGNLTIYGGKAAFNGYAEKLHSLGPLLKVFEVGLIGFAAVHILTGLWLFLQNRKARPVRYTLDTSPGGRTLSSRTMPYTGLIILAFVAFHLTNFTFADKTRTTIFEIVSAAFSSPIYIGIYVAAMIVVGLHVRHGFWSAFQTLGANHPKLMPTISALSVAAGLIVGFGFGLLPIFISLRY